MRQRERGRETERETSRQRDRETETETDREMTNVRLTRNPCWIQGGQALHLRKVKALSTSVLLVRGRQGLGGVASSDGCWSQP